MTSDSLDEKIRTLKFEKKAREDQLVFALGRALLKKCAHHWTMEQKIGTLLDTSIPSVLGKAWPDAFSLFFGKAPV
jgi:hypothetical protein